MGHLTLTHVSHCWSLQHTPCWSIQHTPRGAGLCTLTTRLKRRCHLLKTGFCGAGALLRGGPPPPLLPGVVFVFPWHRVTSDPWLMRVITRIKRAAWNVPETRFKLLHCAANTVFFMTQEITLALSFCRHKRKKLMENHKLSRGHINLDVNRQAIMF